MCNNTSPYRYPTRKAKYRETESSNYWLNTYVAMSPEMHRCICQVSNKLGWKRSSLQNIETISRKWSQLLYIRILDVIFVWEIYITKTTAHSSYDDLTIYGKISYSNQASRRFIVLEYRLEAIHVCASCLHNAHRIWWASYFTS